MSDKVKYPFGEADSKIMTATGTQAFTIVDAFTVIDGETTQATGNRTINLTLDSDLSVGSKLFIKSKTAGTQTTIFGTGVTGTTITGVAGKTITRTATFDGTAFLLDNQQID